MIPSFKSTGRVIHLPFGTGRVCLDLPARGPRKEESGEGKTRGNMTVSANKVLRMWTEGRSELLVVFYGVVWLVALMVMFTGKRYRL
ncbi:MAG TPA: hypothetical protein VH681_09890 [Nitrospiraceae bacterium]